LGFGPVGQYTLTVESPGFKTSRQSGNKLVVGTPLAIDVTLEVGAATDVVKVEAAAAAARRRELEISQRSLATAGIINAGALIAFEKGRSWPRKGTRSKLEEVLRWPEGAIARIRRGDPISGDPETPTPALTTDGPQEDRPEPDGAAALIAQAILAAVEGCRLAIAALPTVDTAEFTERARPILDDLSQLESIAARAARISRRTPELIRALSGKRQLYNDLMMRVAGAPDAPLAQRIFAARRRSDLSIAEIAHAAGVSEETITLAEAGHAIPAGDADAIEMLLSQIS
jgi:transcriptional regulator with XRE-family HTH domain